MLLSVVCLWWGGDQRLRENERIESFMVNEGQGLEVRKRKELSWWLERAIGERC